MSKVIDVKDRFKKYAQQQPSGCIEWQSTVKRDGYGRFYFEGKQVGAHRVAYMIFVGEIPAGYCVLHKCDNRKCVNPDHLFLGTYQDNFRDMVDKGRHWGRRKLSDDQVKEIVKMLKEGKSQQSIADHVGISQITVSRINLGQRRYLPFALKGT